MDELVVAVLTYRRADQIAELTPLLVDEVARLQSAAGERWQASVLIVDNDPDASARDTLAPVIERASQPVRYVHEPTPGISAARNRALDESPQCRALVFIDDDERPVDGWLAAMVRTYESTGATAVLGAVVPQFELEPDAFIREGRFFVRRRQPTGTRLPAAATNNLLLDVPAISAWNLRFADVFGLSGGEDTAFTKQIVARGGSIVFCDDGILTDLVPASRMTRAFVLTKAFHFGNVEVSVAMFLANNQLGRRLVRMRFIYRGLLRLLLGTAEHLAGRILGVMRWNARGSWTAAKGRGMIAGAFGHHHLAYRRDHAQP
jgi:glycosyltransferase involved in cell wall biosynthesis